MKNLLSNVSRRKYCNKDVFSFASYIRFEVISLFSDQTIDEADGNILHKLFPKSETCKGFTIVQQKKLLELHTRNNFVVFKD